MKALKRKRENGVHHHGLLYCLLFYVFWCFNFLGFTNTGETTHPKVSHFLDNEQHSREHTFQIHNSQSRAHTPTATFTGLSYSRPLIICPNHPRARCQTARGSPFVPEPTGIFPTRQSYSAQPASLISSWRNYNKDFCPRPCQAPSSWLNLGLLHVPRPQLLGSMSKTNCLFSGSCLLICWLCHT